MFIANSFDKDKVSDGVWGDFSGAQFKIAASDNTRYVAAVKLLTKPHKKRMERGEMESDELNNILCEAMSRALLLDWKDVFEMDDKGNVTETKYTKEDAKRLLIDNKELREFVSEFAQENANFKKEAIGEAVDKAKKST